MFFFEDIGRTLFLFVGTQTRADTNKGRHNQRQTETKANGNEGGHKIAICLFAGTQTRAGIKNGRHKIAIFLFVGTQTMAVIKNGSHKMPYACLWGHKQGQS